MLNFTYSFHTYLSLPHDLVKRSFMSHHTTISVQIEVILPLLEWVSALLLSSWFPTLHVVLFDYALRLHEFGFF